jgi:hypothetical protein
MIFPCELDSTMTSARLMTVAEVVMHSNWEETVPTNWELGFALTGNSGLVISR